MKVDKEKWEKRKFSQIGTSQLGKTLDSKKNKGNPYPYLCAVNVGYGKFSLSNIKQILLEDSELERYRVIRGDLLICEGGETGRCAIWDSDEPIYYQNALHRVRFVSDVYNRFIMYTLHYYKQTGIIDRFSHGQTIKHFTQKGLNQLTFRIPPIYIQHSIARELDSVQAMIDGYRQQIADLDTLAQSIFLDTFGDPVSNPKGWEMSNYDCQFKVSSGGTPSKKVAEYWNGGDIPWIGSNMCTNSILYKTDGKTITQLGLDNSSAKIFPSGTILVALVGATIGKCGLLAIPTSTNQNIAGLNIKDEETLTPLYAFYHTMFLYPLFQDIGDGKFTISNQGFIKKLPICLPPLPLQHHFAAQIESIEKQKKQLRRQLADAETLMAERMQYYFA